MPVFALVSTDGFGGRRDAGHPGAWALVNGKPLIWHAVQRLRSAGADTICAAVASDRISEARATLRGLARVVAGDRPSVIRDVIAAASGADRPSVVLIHDATRAFIPVDMVRRVIDAVRAGAGVAVPVLPVVDTIRSIGDGGDVVAVVDRDQLRIVQTPQGFSADVWRRLTADPRTGEQPKGDAADRGVNHAAAPGFPRVGHEAGLAQAIGERIQLVAGHADGFTIATAVDLDHARRLFGSDADRAIGAAT